MTGAETAAASWYQRAVEIIADYKTSGPSARTWQEADVAANGAAALLQHRYSELSAKDIDRLDLLVDVMADVKAKSLGAAQGDPLAAAADAFVESIQGDLNYAAGVAARGVDGVVKAGGSALKWAVAGIVGVATVLLIRELSRK